MRIIPRRQVELARQVPVRRILRLAVHAHHLLARGVRHARENARLRDRGVALVLQHAADRDPLVAKIFQQQPPRFIVAHNAHGQDIHSQIRQVICGVGSAAGHHGAFAVLQDQHRRFARHARNFAEDELVGHQIAQHRDGELGEGFDDLLQAVGFFGMFGH